MALVLLGFGSEVASATVELFFVLLVAGFFVAFLRVVGSLEYGDTRAGVVCLRITLTPPPPDDDVAAVATELPCPAVACAPGFTSTSWVLRDRRLASVAGGLHSWM